MHVTIAIGDAAVTHQYQDLVDRFGILGKVIPEYCRIIRVGEVSCRVTLLGVNEMGEFGGIAEKEDGGVVGNNVPVSFVGPELDRESTGITSAVVRAGFATDRRESNCDGTFLALLEYVCQREVIGGMRGLVDTVSAATLCMHNSFGDSLAVEV